eukprot:GHVT01029887.1.p1 GENE.GHVT01029887.1~~GHVT01029887.1.p1  ORF type:complete len:341 (-),score=51.10 GHVT01029887.1:1189-2211(-)
MFLSCGLPWAALGGAALRLLPRLPTSARIRKPIFLTARRHFHRRSVRTVACPYRRTHQNGEAATPSASADDRGPTALRDRRAFAAASHNGKSDPQINCPTAATTNAEGSPRCNAHLGTNGELCTAGTSSSGSNSADTTTNGAGTSSGIGNRSSFDPSVPSNLYPTPEASPCARVEVGGTGPRSRWGGRRLLAYVGLHALPVACGVWLFKAMAEAKQEEDQIALPEDAEEIVQQALSVTRGATSCLCLANDERATLHAVRAFPHPPSSRLLHLATAPSIYGIPANNLTDIFTAAAAAPLATHVTRVCALLTLAHVPQSLHATLVVGVAFTSRGGNTSSRRS